MKTLKIILLAILMGIIALLVIGLGMGLTNNGTFGDQQSRNSSTDKLSDDDQTSQGTMELSEIDEICINYDNDLSLLEIHQSQDEEFYYEEYSHGEWKEPTTFSKEGDKLILQNLSNSGFNFKLFDFSFMDPASILKVYIPKSYSGSISIKVIAADITGYTSLNLDQKSEVNISTVSGDILLQEIVAEETELTSVSGEIEVEKIDSNMNIKTTSGDININKANQCGEAKSVSGSIEVNWGDITGDIRLKTVSGDIRLELPKDAAFELEANTTSGDISGYMENQLDFNNSESHATGNINGSDQYQIEISTTSGDIEIPGRD